MSNTDKKLGLWTTCAFVIANMVGVGVFTSLGYQLSSVPNKIAVLFLWIIGGVIALCGSLVYGELGAAMPRSGGEYHYLTKIYHPLAGFLSGWVSLTVGFAAPVAAACMALGTYLKYALPSFNPQYTAVVVLLFITAIHTYSVGIGSRFQNFFTAFKILLIIVFVFCGLTLTIKFQEFGTAFHQFRWKDLLTPGFAVSLYFVSYAFSGWNASAYIAGEMRNPKHNLPKSLLMSTALVTILYFLLNLVFLLAAPIADLQNKTDVGNVAAGFIFGHTGGNIMALLISILLVSTISSMVFVGPRVSHTMGEDMRLLRFLSFRSKKGTPVVAVILQSFISLVLILTASFGSIILYVGFTLSLFTFMAVLGVFIHRIKYKDVERPYKTWGYPVVPIIFLLAGAWSLYYLISTKPLESSMGLLTVVAGSIIYFINQFLERKKININTNNSKL